MSDKVKISYSSKQIRVRVSFPATATLELETPPMAVVKKAMAKLDSEKKAGRIFFYKVYQKEYSQLWKNVREQCLADAGHESTVVFTLAAGTPELKDVSVDIIDSPKVAYLLTIKADGDTVKKWSFDFLQLNIERHLKERNVSPQANMSQVYSCWLRAQRNEKIELTPIVLMPSVPASNNKKFYMLGNKNKSEVAVMITDADVFRNKKLLETVVKASAIAVRKMKVATGIDMEFLQSCLVDRLRHGLQGVERYGINIPAVYLVGYPEHRQFDQMRATAVEQRQVQAAPKAASAESIPTGSSGASEDLVGDYPGFNMLNISISDDKMRASIENFDVALYDHPDFTADLSWIKREMKRCKLKVEMLPRDEATLSGYITKGDDLSGFVLVEGKYSAPAKGPYLYESYKELKPSTATEIEHVDLREMQQRVIVNTGDLIVEVRFEEDPVIGLDVFHTELMPEEGENLVLNVGEGVEVRENRRFFATFDGIPVIENDTIALSQVLIHDGDVNLRTGNIRFDGPAEIKGAIDSGATVEVTGDLIVHGTIRDAFVRVGGNLEAKSGIVTGRRGMVRVRNDILADFIENSSVICGGNLNIRKVLINSVVVAGGNIRAHEQNGVIAGGRISCRKCIRTAKLGFPQGSKTYIYGGVDWRAKLSIDIRQGRLEALQNANVEDRNAMRELTRKKHKTKKHVEKINYLKERLQRQREIIEKIKVHLEAAQAGMSYDSDTRVYVHDILHANVEIELAGTPVAVVNDVAEVVISPKRNRGSHIHPLEDDPEGEALDGGSSRKAPKKAS